MSTPSLYDSCIIGGGLSGLTMALSLAKNGMSSAIIDRHPLSNIINHSADGRCSAITLGSAQFFDKIGLWNHIAEHAGPILDIRVTDADSHAHVHFDHSELGADPMGYIIPNHIILKGLANCIESYADLISFHTTSHYEWKEQATYVDITYDKTHIRTPLLIAADGRHSQLRKQAGISHLTHNYNQHGIVCSIRHEHPHHGLAHERFLPTGPFAALPLIDPHESSLVWTEKPELAQHYLAMDEKEFSSQIEQRLNHHLGKVSAITQRFSYPLTLILAHHYVQGRLILIGDAAHGIHPLAGQGFNLGIRDIISLSRLIKEAFDLGLDIGANSTLKDYEQLRYTDSLSMAFVTDGLNQLFLHQWGPIKLVRRLGLRLVNRTATLKHSFMKHAMGMNTPL